MKHFAPLVLITGAAKRAGREIALYLASRGYAIAVHYHQSEKEARVLVKEIRAAGGICETFQADFMQEKEVSALIPAVAKKMGALAALINNAALFQRDTAENFTPGAWDMHHKINTQAPLVLSHAFAEQLPEGNTGCIVNILDGGHGWSMGPNFFSYAASKLALWDETAPLAIKLAPNIRVVGVAPGHMLASEDETEAMQERMRQATPLKHLSNTAELCEAIFYLLNAQSLTGQVLELGGGLHLSLRKA